MRSSILVLVLFVCGCASLRADDNVYPDAHMKIGGSTIDVQFLRRAQDANMGASGDAADAPSRAELMRWIARSATAVVTYYGKFPRPHLALNVFVGGRRGVHHGVTWPWHGGTIRIGVGHGTTREDFEDDWELTHEMVHLAFPSMSDDHHWIEEGISTYVEPVARAQAGQLSSDEVWKQFIRDMPKGQPEEGDRGLDNTHTWGRTYWGGALFCLVADVRYRELTHNQKGLQDALRAILDHGDDITTDADIEKVLSQADRWVGMGVLDHLYNEMALYPDPIDLNALWKKLGVSLQDGKVVYDESAPEAKIRRAITAKRSFAHRTAKGGR